MIIRRKEYFNKRCLDSQIIFHDFYSFFIYTIFKL